MEMSAISKTMRVLARAEVVASWAGETHKASTIGELLAFEQESDGMPSDVAEVWQKLLSLPLEEVIRINRKVRVAALAVTLLTEMPPSRRSVFKERCLALDPLSLEKLGNKMRVTRERVRQLENAAVETVNAVLRQPRFKILPWRAQALAGSLGAAMPVCEAKLKASLREVGCTGNLEDVSDQLLLWLAGPYKLKLGWLVRRDTVVPCECSRLVAFADKFGVIGTRQKAGELLSAMDLQAEVRDAWLRDCRYVRVFRGTAIVSRGSVADKSVPLLFVLGSPQTPERLAELVGEGHLPMTVRNAVRHDPRFVRCSKNEVGLSAWNLEPFPCKRQGRGQSQVLPDQQHVSE